MPIKIVHSVKNLKYIIQGSSKVFITDTYLAWFFHGLLKFKFRPKYLYLSWNINSIAINSNINIIWYIMMNDDIDYNI